MASKGLASRLYRGDAGLQIVARRKLWFTVAGVIVLVAIASFVLRGFSMGIEFRGGNEFQVPASVGTLKQAQDAVGSALGKLQTAEPSRVVSGQSVGGGGGEPGYLIRTSELEAPQSAAVKADVAARFGIQPEAISDNRVSEAWGSSVTESALLGLAIFLAVVTLYLVVRFESRMAIAALAALLLDLVFTAGVYSLVGFEVTPSTVVGFLTILGFALYDVVVVFDKIQENTRGITAGSSQTYGEAANLAVNQTIMRSINTSVVALLPVGGLLFIGAGLLGAGTLKDLGLVLFVGMATAFFSSIFLATPLLVSLKEREPRIKAHGQRVLARRAAQRSGDVAPKGSRSGATAVGAQPADEQVAALASAAPKAGARPAGKRPSGGRGGRSGGAGNRPSGAKRR